MEAPIRAKVRVPGSKSFTNRALIMAALAEGTTFLEGGSIAEDSAILVRALRVLGVFIEEKEGILQVQGSGGSFPFFEGVLDVGDAGTAMRFLTALCSTIPGTTIIKGSPRMHERPIQGLVDALRFLGARITYLGKEGSAPIKIEGGYLRGGRVLVDASLSSQFVSSLLMIAPILPFDTEIIAAEGTPSLSYIGITASIMQSFGASLKIISPWHYLVKGYSGYKSCFYSIEPDASSASYFFGLAALTQSCIRVDGLSEKSVQGDVRFVDILEKMGSKVIKTEKYIEVEGTSALKGVTVDMVDMPDTAQTLSVIAAFAKGTTYIQGLKTLELKETRRLTALYAELSRVGIHCCISEETIKIEGGLPRGAPIRTYNDHRMAMSFALSGAIIKDVRVEDPFVVRKSFPDFWDQLLSLGVGVEFQ